MPSTSGGRQAGGAKNSNGKWRDAGPALVVSNPVAWPGHPAFAAQYRVRVRAVGQIVILTRLRRKAL
jgi:hypothetical protein